MALETETLALPLVHVTHTYTRERLYKVESRVLNTNSTGTGGRLRQCLTEVAYWDRKTGYAPRALMFHFAFVMQIILCFFSTFSARMTHGLEFQLECSYQLTCTCIIFRL